MKRSFLALCLFTAFSLNASAIETPKSSRYDSRMQHVNYNANDVVEIRTKDDFVTSVLFADDETVSDISTGFSQGWDVQSNQNRLYIKAKPVQQNEQFFAPSDNLEDWHTNLLVSTNKRTYAFDLRLVNSEKEVNAYFMKFAYPTEEQLERQLEADRKRKEQAEAQAKIQREAEQKEVNAQLDKYTVPRNWDYTMKVGKDSREIAPKFTYDDGVRTYIGFDTVNSIPAVFYYQGEQEMMSNVNTKKQGAYTVIVVHKTAQRFILRNGDQVVGIVNHGFGKNPTSDVSTTNSGVIRAIKE